MDRIVLAFDGGVESSLALAWLAESGRGELVTVTVDLGQEPTLEDVRDRALALGAARAHVLDAREAFADDFILPALKANALDCPTCPIHVALSRPLIARTLAEVAQIEGATLVATGSRRHDSRVRAALGRLAPNLTVLAPVRDRGMTRAQAIEEARGYGWSDTRWERIVASNLLGRATVIAVQTEGQAAAPAGGSGAGSPAASYPEDPAYVEIAFGSGAPTAINGISMSLVDLIASLNIIAGRHGIGRAQLESPPGGDSIRWECEIPAAPVLQAAHMRLEADAISPDAARFARTIRQEYADLVCRGGWFDPLRVALDAAVDRLQSRVTGIARLKLFKGAHVHDNALVRAV